MVEFQCRDLGNKFQNLPAFETWMSAFVLPDDGNRERKVNTIPYMVGSISKSFTIPAAGAITIRVPGISGIYPPYIKPLLAFHSNDNLYISITSKDDDFNGNSKIGTQGHVGFETAVKNTYYYGDYDATNIIRELYITIVNPKLSSVALLDLSFEVGSEFWVGTFDQVSTANITGTGVEFVNFDLCKMAMTNWGERDKGEIRFREGNESDNVRLDYIDGGWREWNSCKTSTSDNQHLLKNEYEFTIPSYGGFGFNGTTTELVYDNSFIFYVNPTAGNTITGKTITGIFEGDAKYYTPAGFPGNQIDVIATCSGKWRASSTLKPFPKCLLDPGGVSPIDTDQFLDSYIAPSQNHRTGEWDGFEW